jgi:S1-C subfamily serine protease
MRGPIGDGARGEVSDVFPGEVAERGNHAQRGGRRCRRRLEARPVRLAAVLLAGCALGALLAGCGGDDSGPHVSDGGDQGGDPFGRIPAVVKNVEPSIVTVTTNNSVGSGVVYRSNGQIVTDEHVIAKAKSIRVTFADGQTMTARRRAGDSVTDLAVLQVERNNLPAATFASKPPALGDLAVVLGSPLGLSKSVSAGIVSGFDRNLPASGETPAGLVGLMQTDAPISPGNSGGAVVDADGDVIGISEAYVPPTSGAVAIGFATPAATVVSTVNQLIATGHARHAFLGVQETDLTPQTAKLLGLSTSNGVLVLTVVPNSPAAKGGLRASDVIIGYDGKSINNTTALDVALRSTKPGQAVTLRVVRKRKHINLRVTVVDRPGTTSSLS